MTPRRSITTLITCLTLASLLIPATSGAALAAPTVGFQGGTLTVTGKPKADSIAVTCAGGEVSVDGSGTGVGCGAVDTFVLNGGGGDDTLDASGMFTADFTSLTDATINGQDGHDDLFGWQGPETLKGGPGFDVLQTSDGNDILFGGPSSDGVAGTSNVNWTLTDTSLTGAGTDTLSSIEEASLTGGPGINIIDASLFTGYVSLSGAAGADTMSGGSGDDTLYGGDGGDTLNGGEGDDFFQPDDTVAANDIVNGGNGIDSVFSPNLTGAGTLLNSSMVGKGTDTLSSIEEATMYSSGVGITLDATAFSGDTSLSVSNGSNALGGSGDDFLQGAQAGTLDGNGGTDSVLMGNGGDTTVGATTYTHPGGTVNIPDVELLRIHYSSTDGTIDASAWPHELWVTSWGGTDTLIGNGLQTQLIVYALEGPVKLTKTKLTGSITGTPSTLNLANVGGLVSLYASGPMALKASRYPKAIEVRGSEGNDTLITGKGKDVLVGNEGNDRLFGGGKGDSLYGGGGKDALDGGLGIDGCNSGPGIDTLTSCEKSIPNLPNDEV